MAKNDNEHMATSMTKEESDKYYSYLDMASTDPNLETFTDSEREEFSELREKHKKFVAEQEKAMKEERSKQKKESKKGKTARVWAVERRHSYDADPQNPEYAGISANDWRSLIHQTVKSVSEQENVQCAAYIFHDRCKTAENKPTGLHAHMIVLFHEPVNYDYVTGVTGDNSGRKQNCQPARDPVAYSMYLRHLSEDALEKGKTEYRADEVIGFNCNWYTLAKKSSWKKAGVLADSPVIGGIDPTKHIKGQPSPVVQAKILMAEIGYLVRAGVIRANEAMTQFERTAGYYWLREYPDPFGIDRDLHVRDRVTEMTLDGRNMTNMYIMGAGGIGKSNLARKFGKKLADGKGLYATAPLGQDKTFDALNNYIDEAVAIYNEMSPRGWTLDEFLSCFDFYEYATFPGRNKNRDFIGHTNIFTNSLSPLRFAEDLVIYAKGGSKFQDPTNSYKIDRLNPDAMDKYWQSRRRLKNIVVLVRDNSDANKVYAGVFNLRRGVKRSDGTINSNDGDHVLVGYVSFTAEAGKEPEITDEVLEELNDLCHVSTDGMFQGVTTISQFLEDNDMIESAKDPVIDDFVQEFFIDNQESDIESPRHVYDAYVAFCRVNHPSLRNLLNKNECLRKVEEHLPTNWERKQGNTRISKDMRTQNVWFIHRYGLYGERPGGKSKYVYDKLQSGGYTSNLNEGSYVWNAFIRVK